MSKIILFVIIGIIAIGFGFLAVKDITPEKETVVKEISLPAPKAETE